MKFIGHAASAIIITAPIIHFRHSIAETGLSPLSDLELLGIVGFFSVLPDIDIILSRFTPLKHRGFLTHSLLTILLTGLFFLIGGLILEIYPQAIDSILQQKTLSVQLTDIFSIFVAVLAMLAVLAHILGDSLTKTGIPLLYPSHKWHMPYIGGYAAFDNWALNLIPCTIAAILLSQWFGVGANLIRKIGRLDLPF